MEKETGFLDKPENIKKIRWIFYVILVILVGLDFFIHKHPHFSWEKIPGFFAIYGFVACVVIIAVSKNLGRFLKKKEDYYD